MAARFLTPFFTCRGLLDLSQQGVRQMSSDPAPSSASASSAPSGASSRIAVVLLSGGLDSSTALANAVEQGFTPYAISF
ncbi:MAG TPA: 7-cyano-7-deazaguanine synthase, partial [Ktedonobacterales bacterium]|nr:7-cyano-7-deazaguanine synthase [Ktedonobacterales bacterium]